MSSQDSPPSKDRATKGGLAAAGFNAIVNSAPVEVIPIDGSYVSWSDGSQHEPSQTASAANASTLGVACSRSSTSYCAGGTGLMPARSTTRHSRGPSDGASAVHGAHGPPRQMDPAALAISTATEPMA